MRMKHWRTKAALQRVFSAMPGGDRLNYGFQRLLSGLPLSDITLAGTASIALRHIDNARIFVETPLEEMRTFEFGAGWDLHGPILLRALGVRHQTLVDLRPLVRPSLVRDVASRVQAYSPPEGSDIWDPFPPPAAGDDLPAWLRSAGIDYRAPADAAMTGLRAGSVDLITSTNTLEHIPRSDIRAILAEMKRIIAPGGICSYQIDESDHYSHFDTTIGAYNFLQYDEAAWNKYNSSLHFQNRLRHSDYLQLFEESGWDVLSVEAKSGEGAAEALASVPLVPPFDRMEPEDVMITTTWVVLGPR